MKKIKSLRVTTDGKQIGELDRGPQFKFHYLARWAKPKDAVSLLMPVSTVPMSTNRLPPVFEMNLPEGYLRQRIIERFRKHAKVDEMFFLALQGNDSIGRIGFESQEIERAETQGVDLGTILAAHDPDQFEALVDQFIDQTTIAGVQPKTLIRESGAGKSLVNLPSLIVKTDGGEYPHLAINEYICMSIAREAGLEVPEFHLSDDNRLFVMRRFDILPDGTRLGMEDICALMGKHSEEKYESSCEKLAKAVYLFSENPVDDLAKLFRSLCVSVMVGNGDAHLKNFAILYENPETQKGRLSPTYDIVNTTLYTPTDTLALGIGGSKVFPNRKAMIDFGAKHCLLKRNDAEGIIDEAATAVACVCDQHSELIAEVELEGRTLKEQLEHGILRLAKPEIKAKDWQGEAVKPKRTR